MDRQGPPNRPRYQLTRALTRTRHEKDAMTSRCLDRKRKYDAPPGECTLLAGPAGIIYRTSFSFFFLFVFFIFIQRVQKM